MGVSILSDGVGKPFPVRPAADDDLTFNRISTQFTEMHLHGATLQTSWQCRHNLHILTAQSNKVDGR